MKNVGLNSTHMASFHMLRVLLMMISTLPLSNPTSNTKLVSLYLCYFKTPSKKNILE